MASSDPSTPFPGATNIRSLKDQDSVYKAFDAYPWTKDAAFLSGLHAILGGSNPRNPQASPRDIATHARIFYYAQRIGVSIDFASYQQWLAQHPDHNAPDILPEPASRSHSQTHPVGISPTSTSSATSASTLAWQQAAPRAELYVDRAAHAHAQAQPSASGEPSYPMAFADMIRLIQEGKPVPGIRQIPNTVERNSTVSPVGSRPVPRKPWERGGPSSDLPKSLDLEFPPVDEEP
ncbi:hypothetical protein ESCO_005433 [Escovopsis weberi]|uniref:Uncharacterized protein n=1 Tax=Escovopsis weberi TaxID=150374 RepID=A0A0M9VV13_ESCWE|nr:hypothetical protein ESCO_005433 [Escovopsis weberi]